ncbi:GNAT family N-acetyltransferase [Shewanella sp. 202IG2-18]|uniref:GNAT family N-acetyltransferase n=1 Tax=Parashewanella hymeniacidonis TaxID=2807618 RepID=UPI001961EBB3|nr:GNAT family protein [Parashewanella hymeniacidonis]MBM7074457.1 GNAT family N-acetyltransferase [Parashewanella hymeniacidonis]
MDINKFGVFPTLHSERLTFAEQTLDFKQQVYQLLSDEDVTKYYDLHLKSETEATELIDTDKQKFLEGKSIHWVVVSTVNDQFIGSCGINRFDEHSRSAVISYELCKKSWGLGYATEIVQTITDFIFSEQLPLPVNKIEAYFMQGNLVSEKVLNKVGFNKDGILREHGFWKGQFHDLSLFSLLRSENQKNKDDLCTKVA